MPVLPSNFKPMVCRLCQFWFCILVFARLGATAQAEPMMGSQARTQPEALSWLQEYIQIDTTNPPGNEHQAAQFLAEILRREGFDPKLLESPTGRTSLYVRWRHSASAGRAIALLHHIDVVPAEATWKTPPFSGRPWRGKVWGRGTLDVKGLGIAQLAALVSLKRSGAILNRDVIFLAVADEETGGKEGAQWLLEAHPELFEGLDGVLNEGGSNRVIGDRLIWWGIEVTQKRPLWLKITARGRGGHGSGLNPGSATHQLIKALGRLLELPLKYRVNDAARLYFGALAKLDPGSGGDFFRRLDEIIQEDGPTIPLSPGLPVYFVDTLQVTEIQNGKGVNVVAPEAQAFVDIRLLPDSDGEAYLKKVREALGPRMEVEVLLSAPETPASPTNHPFFQALEQALGVRGPVIPTFMAGTTDSRFFRAQGIPAYGFTPFTINSDDLRGIHAPNESIPRDAFLRGVETMRRVILACGGARLGEEN